MCTLSYIHLLSPQCEAMQDFYVRQAGLTEVLEIGADSLPSDIDIVEQRSETTSTRLLRGPQRQIMLSPSETAKLGEVGLEVFESRWSDAERVLQGMNAMPLDWHPVFLKAYALTDPEGNRTVFGSGLRHPAAKSSAGAKAAADTVNVLPGRLQHFGLGTSRIGEQSAFYQNQLGFALSDYVTGNDRKLRSTFLRTTDEHHILAFFANGKPGLDHFSFEAPDWNGIRDWGDHFASFGTKIFWGAGRHGVGNNLFVFVHDPDGNMVEISAELESVPWGREAGHWAFDYKAFNLWGPAAIRV